VITHSEVGTGQKINPKICTGSIKGERDHDNRDCLRSKQEFVLPSIRLFRYYYHKSVSLAQSSCSFYHLLGNNGTATTYRFRLFSRRVCNLQLRNILVAVWREED